jgi:hypothetical protein
MTAAVVPRLHVHAGRQIGSWIEVSVVTGVVAASDSDQMAAWLDRQSAVVPRARGQERAAPVGRLRFAFYGRISTTGFQDAASSRRWQHDSATDVIAGHGMVVAEYFDVGCSRRRPWHQRPQAAALLAALADPARGFEAIVVGEYERAFCGHQLIDLLPVLSRYGDPANLFGLHWSNWFWPHRLQSKAASKRSTHSSGVGPNRVARRQGGAKRSWCGGARTSCQEHRYGVALWLLSRLGEVALVLVKLV